MARLNPCPICGGEATGQFCKGDTLQFAYEHCGICGGYRNDWKAARIAWNKTTAEWISAKGGKKVDRHTATECAYKNGFAAGMKAAEEKIVRCQECTHAEPLDRHCEINTCAYMHCKMWRGETERNVWHKYKKYYKDYSIVDRDGFCDYGERRNNAVD
jgi:hypothetical protein